MYLDRKKNCNFYIGFTCLFIFKYYDYYSAIQNTVENYLPQSLNLKDFNTYEFNIKIILYNKCIFKTLFIILN